MHIMWRQTSPGVYDALVMSGDDGVEHLIAQVGQEDQTFAFVARELVYVSDMTDGMALQAAKEAISTALASLAVTLHATFPFPNDLSSSPGLATDSLS